MWFTFPKWTKKTKTFEQSKMGPWSFSNRMGLLHYTPHFFSFSTAAAAADSNECVICTHTKHGEATLYPEYPLLIGVSCGSMQSDCKEIVVKHYTEYVFCVCVCTLCMHFCAIQFGIHFSVLLFFSFFTPFTYCFLLLTIFPSSPSNCSPFAREKQNEPQKKKKKKKRA